MRLTQRTPNLYIERFNRRIRSINRWNLFYDLVTELIMIILFWTIILLILSANIPNGEILV